MFESLPTAASEKNIYPWKHLHGLSIPDRFTASVKHFTGVTFPDRLTGLPVMTDEFRHILVRKVTHAIRKGYGFAVGYFDVDNLKSANEIDKSRVLGDILIRWGAARTTQVLQTASFLAYKDVVAVRKEHAADEIAVWVTDVTPTQMLYLKYLEELIEMPECFGNISFPFSLSSAWVTSYDADIQKELEKTREWLFMNPEQQAYNFFRDMEKRAAGRVDAKKEEKRKLKAEKELPAVMQERSLSQFIGELGFLFGPVRISGPTAVFMLQLQSLKMIQLGWNTLTQEAQDEYRHGGVTPERIQSIRSIDEANRLFELMQRVHPQL